MSAAAWMALQLSLLLLTFSGYARGYVDTDAGRLHYFEAEGSGSQPPVLLIHGIGSAASDWFPVSQALRPYVRKVIMVDLPGHGLSEVPVEKLTVDQVEASIDQGLDRLLADEPPVTLIGNSLGGWQALNYALHNQAELASLVLISPAGARIDAGEHARLKQIFAHDSIEAPQKLIPLLFNQAPPFPDTIGDFLKGRFSQPGVQALLRNFGAETCLPAERLGELRMPILMIWGHQDRIFPVELPFFKKYLPARTRYLEPAHFTHSPYIEAGMEQELVQAIVGWQPAEPACTTACAPAGPVTE